MVRSYTRPLVPLVVLLLTACAPAAPPAPSAASAPSAPAQATAEWQQAVEAARREGTISILTFEGTEVRDALVEGFQRKYPSIHLDYSGVEIAQIPPKMIMEQSVGQFRTDLVIAGTTTAITTMMPANVLTPVPPYLVGPNSSDPSKWQGGKLDYADDAGEYNLVFSGYVKPHFVISNDVALDEFKSLRDLLNPKWKGRIVMRNPAIPGGSQGSVVFWYDTPSLGQDFIRQLFQQEIVLSNNDTQILDWVARGQYAIGIGPSDPLANETIAKGLPLRQVPGHQMQEGTYMTAGPGSVMIPRNPPHPNALKVYLDHLLSAEGQEAWTKAIGLPSLRTDVPVDPAWAFMVPKPGVSYPATYKQRYVELRAEVLPFLQTVLPR
jgi:iron(III) transport system substrate-binding protein